MQVLRRLAFLVLAVFILSATLPGAASAEPPPPVPLPLLGQIGGKPNDNAADGRYAYLAIGRRVQVVDLHDPAHPIYVAQTPILPDEALSIALQEGVLYVAVTPGVFIFDVSDAAAIHQIGFWPQSDPGEPVFNVKVRGRFAFVAGGQGLRVLDVTDPTAPASVGLLAGVVGSYLALAPGEGQPVYVGHLTDLYIVSVTDPRHPALAADFTLGSSSYVTAVAALDNYVYVGYSYQGSSKGSVVALDVSTPTAPQQVGGTTAGGYVRGLTPAHDLLYASVIGRGLVQLDVADPSAPVVAAEQTLPSDPVAAALIAGSTHLAVADRLQGLVVFDSMGKGNLTRTAALDLPGACDDVAVSSNVAICASGMKGGVRAFDISNPAAPRQILADLMLSAPNRVAANGNRFYVADSHVPALYLYELMAGPTLVRTAYTFTKPATEISSRGNYVYLLDSEAFHILDGATLASLASYPIATKLSFDLGATRAYIYDGAGAIILDISDPARLKAVGALPGRIDRLAAAGKEVFIAGDDSLRVYDVSNPAAPIQTSETPLVPAPNDMLVSGRYLYISFLNHGVRVFGLAGAQPPQETYATSGVGYPEQIAVSSGKLVVAAHAGLLVTSAPEERVYLPLLLK